MSAKKKENERKKRNIEENQNSEGAEES